MIKRVLLHFLVHHHNRDTGKGASGEVELVWRRAGAVKVRESTFEKFATGRERDELVKHYKRLLGKVVRDWVPFNR